MTQGFEQLVVRYQDVVCGVAYAILRDRARSEEIAQEAFLVAWQKRSTLATAEGASVPAWLCGIARNLARNAARRRTEIPLDREPGALDRSALEQLVDAETDELAKSALASLPARDREVVALYYRVDGSIAGIADALGISEDAAKQRLHRGRTRLRAALAHVEATLRRTRPGSAFTLACVGALATRTAAASTAASRVLPATATLAGVCAVVTIVVATATATGARPTLDSEQPTRRAPSTGAPLESTAHADGPRPVVPARAAMTPSVPLRVARSASSPVAGAVPIGLPARPVRTYDLASIRLEDLDRSPAPAATRVTKSTLKRALRATQPMLLECYAAAFDRLLPAHGTLALRVELSGEPGSPTLVETVEVTGDSHLVSDPDLAECVRETVMSIELPELEQPEQIVAHVPFLLAGTRP